MIFKKKVKVEKSEEQIEQEREARIKNVSGNIRAQLITMNNKQSVLVSKVIEAKNKGLNEQEKQARSLLARCLASIRRAEGMLMTLELAVQSRDLAKLNCEFLRCIGDLSDDISTYSTDKVNIKKTEDKYLRALYNANNQVAKIDRLLDIGDFSASVGEETVDYAEFDNEIDSLVKEAEAKLSGHISGNKNKLY